MLLVNVHCIEIFHQFLFHKEYMIIKKPRKAYQEYLSCVLVFRLQNVGLRDLRFTKPAYTQKKQHFDAKSAQNLTCHYQNFCFFWVFAGFVRFWHQHVFFGVYAGFVHSSQNHAFLAFHTGFGEVQVTKPAKGMQFWSEQSSN